MKQQGLDFDAGEPRGVLPLAAAYLDQVLRDLATLREDPVYHSPSREFYEGRILMYREARRELLVNE